MIVAVFELEDYVDRVAGDVCFFEMKWEYIVAHGFWNGISVC